MKQTIIWHNDTNQTQELYFNTLYESSLIASVAPQVSKSIEVEIPDTHNLYIKQWPSGTVLFGSVHKNLIGRTA